MSNRRFEQEEDSGQEEPAMPAALEAAEKRAEASRQRLEEIQSLAKVGSWEWDLAEARASWSDELRRIAGLEPDAPVPTFEEFVEQIHPEDRAEFVASLQRALEEGGIRRNTYRAILPDGTEKLIESHSRVATDESGAPVRVFGAAQDITDRRRVESDLRLQADLLDQVEVAVMASDVNRKLTQWNRAAEKLLGIPRNEALGRTIDEVMRIPPESQPQRDAQVKSLSAGEKWEGEMTLYGVGDEVFPVYATNAPVRDSEGRIVGYSGVVMDLSEITRARERARKLEAQLHQNQRLEAVGQLAGGVAHDFNNLLVVILNYAEFLRAQVDDESLREDVDEIRKAAERAADLTRQLLVFSRREVVVPEVVDLNEVVVEAEGLLQQTVREHIELVHSFTEGLWGVRLGSGQAEQILVNLLVNARNAMPDGGTVDVKTENLDLGPGHGKQGSLADGKYVRLTVADTGVGMRDDVAAQAFDPFFTTRKDDGGTGLGLATVYGIVKEAGGHIEIYTEPGHGTAVKVYLPAVLDEAAIAAPDSRQAVAAAGQTILLVEDEESVRRLAERILVENGYEVITALDGQGALDLAAHHDGDIDLLLTDVVMPRLSGPQLARDLKKLRPRLRALFMSGYTGEVISRHGIVEEGVTLIEKPFDATGLLYAVSSVLHDTRAEEDRS